MHGFMHRIVPERERHAAMSDAHPDALAPPVMSWRTVGGWVRRLGPTAAPTPMATPMLGERGRGEERKAGTEQNHAGGIGASEHARLLSYSGPPGAAGRRQAETPRLIREGWATLQDASRESDC